MKRLKTPIFILFITMPILASAQIINVDDSRSAQNLVEQVLINSNCAQVSGFRASGLSSSGGPTSYAYFNAGSSTFPIREGVVLSTIQSSATRGPFVNPDGVIRSQWAGDIDLNQTFGISSVNATVLEFDFVPLTTSIDFNYIFASNEYYKNNACSYSDAFAFLIKENNGSDTYKNIAVLPQSSTPVSSMSVRPDIPNGTNIFGNPVPGCPASNPTYFAPISTSQGPTSYYGQTVKLKAQTDVVIGKSYHIKLVIAEDRNPFYDSAIFLEAGSFHAGIDLGKDRTLAGNNPLCDGVPFTIDSHLPPTYTFEWYQDGRRLPNENNPTLTISRSGTYKVVVSLPPAGCPAEDEIKIDYAPPIQLNNASLYQCDDNSDGLTLYNLRLADNIIDPAGRTVTYYKTLADAQAQTNPIGNPAAYRNTVPSEVLYARVNAYDCASYAQLSLLISTSVIVPPSPIQSCDTDNQADGITQFDLNAQITPQLGAPAGISVQYYPTPTDAVSQTNQLPNLYRNSNPGQQLIYARLANGPQCQNIIPITLEVSIFDPPNIGDQTQFVCENSSTLLSVDPGYFSYQWSNGSTTNTSLVNSAGEYTVKISNAIGCAKTKKFIVQRSGIASITNASTSDFGGAKNSVQLSYTGSGDYEFSLDGNLYQDSPIFNAVSPGLYQATANDKNGCGLSAPFEVVVLDYPRFFTPNQDNRNDIWKIQNLNFLPTSSIHIFDRYGKLLKQLLNPSEGWDGSYLGRDLPPDDYWFVLSLRNGKELRGHFSLIR